MSFDPHERRSGGVITSREVGIRGTSRCTLPNPTRVFVGPVGSISRGGNRGRASCNTYKSWLFVGRCRTATSSVPLAVLEGALSAFFAAFAAAFAALGVSAGDSSSLPLGVVCKSSSGTGLRGTALRSTACRASSAGNASVASMPVSSERSEELSAADAGNSARRVGLESSISRSCVIDGGLGVGGGRRSASRAASARRTRRAIGAKGESAGRQQVFLLTPPVPYLARGSAALASAGDGNDRGRPLTARRGVAVFEVRHGALASRLEAREDK